MLSFVGIDLGSHLIKAGATRAADGSVEVLQLDSARNAHGLPFVMQAGSELGARWDQYARRRLDFDVAYGFRDRVWEAASRYSLGGEVFDAVPMFQPVCAGVREAITSTGNDAAAVGLSVPDWWEAQSNWTLPGALRADGWNPAVLARESVAALTDWLAQHRATPNRRVLVLSFGAGSTWGSLLSRTGAGAWEVEGTVCDAALSGSAVRNLLVGAFARDVVGRLRKDPTESAADDQQLHDALEQVLHLLQTQNEAELRANLFGSTVTIPFSRTRLLEVTQPIIERFQKTMSQWQQRFTQQGSVDTVLYWGDLASYLTAGRDLARTFAHAETVELDGYCVARGVARLVALVRTGQIAVSKVCSQTQLLLLDTLSENAISGSSDVATPARLVAMSDGAGKVISIGDALRFGRHPEADCVIAQERAEVSKAHAVILRKGSLYVLSDLQSTNGTYLNGKLLSGPTPLSHGDTITLAVDGPSFRFENP